MTKYTVAMTIDRTFNDIESARAEASSLAFKNSASVFILKVAEKAVVQTVIVSLDEEEKIEAAAPAQEEKLPEIKKPSLIGKSQVIEDNEILKEVIENSIPKPVLEDPEINKEIERVFGEPTTTTDSLLEKALKEISAAATSDQLKALSVKYFSKYSGEDLYNEAYERKIQELNIDLLNGYNDELQKITTIGEVNLITNRYKTLEMTELADEFKQLKQDRLTEINCELLIEDLKSVRSKSDITRVIQKYPVYVREIDSVIDAIKSVEDKFNDSGIDEPIEADNMRKEVTAAFNKCKYSQDLEAEKERLKNGYPNMMSDSVIIKLFYEKVKALPERKVLNKASADPEK